MAHNSTFCLWILVILPTFFVQPGLIGHGIQHPRRAFRRSMPRGLAPGNESGMTFGVWRGGGPHTDIPKVVGCAGVSERGGSWQRLPFLFGQLEDGGIFLSLLVELEGGKGN